MDDLITIGKLSKITGVSTRTIRHYESVGLLKCASNTQANYRLYGKEEIRKLEKILIFKSLGFSLQDIFNLLSSKDSQIISSMFSQKLEELNKKEKEILRNKNILTSVTKMYEVKGLDYVNNYHVLKEMVYMNNSLIKTFNNLDLEIQIKILTEVYHTGSISTETIKEIGAEAGTRILNEIHMVAAKTLINKVNQNAERDIMKSLEIKDPEFAIELKKQMFTFEDIIILPDAIIEKWLKKCEDKELIIALSESANSVRHRIYSNMESKRAESLKSSIESLNVPSLDEVYEAMNNLVEVLKEMDCSGKIMIEK